MQENEWLSLVAVHSDVWLLSVAFISGDSYFDKADRKFLFDMINDLPTIFEVVSKKQSTGRRAGIIKALTTDVEEFYQQCDPGKKGLCLYGFPSEKWEVNLRAQKVPSELPEPARGINFARDGTPEDGWLSLVALHSDLWLLSVAFCFGARLLFDKADRNRLFNMINDLPTIVEVVSGPSNEEEEEEEEEEFRETITVVPYYGCSLEKVFQDFKGSLAGIIKALTTDVEDFYRQCDPENERLCLYGFPTEVWKVKLPARDLPAELPEPTAARKYVKDFYQQCTPENGNLCLYGFPSEQWAVNFPAEKLPPELPMVVFSSEIGRMCDKFG
ncbi:hypothetical protein V6N12_057682 [Hibiscus sabdariffa]|uniref:PHD finger protein ALFIN-LIKE n=1 Tax=Hibiscus sabdariffa TaxID=183260 RepID=A0ABR2C694_9ROSI